MQSKTGALKILNKVSVAFAAGSAGGLATALTVWLFGVLGYHHAIRSGPGATAHAAIYLLDDSVGWNIWVPVSAACDAGFGGSRGIIFGLAPTVVQCLIVFPVKLEAGLLGLGLGKLTPVFVLLFNTVWGQVTALLFVRAGGDR